MKAKNMVPYFIIVTLIFFALAVGSHFSVTGQEKITRSEFLMDTVVASEVFVNDVREGEQILAMAYHEMYLLENMLSRHRPKSEIVLINNAAGKKPVEVSPATLDVITKALTIGDLTEGAFDITIAPLVNLWGFGTDNERVPSAAELSDASEKVDYRRVEVDLEKNEVFLPHSEMKLDLGGIAKGYIVDKAAEVLIQNGITSAFLNGGGDIRVIGQKADGSPWRVGVRHPRERRKLALYVEIRDAAIVTSGDYERFFIKKRIRYHHILNPVTGMPSQEIASVTVVAPTAVAADAFSTAIFVMGAEKGLQMVESLDEIEMIIITAEGEVIISSGLEDKTEVLM